jgi:hypothetical protein
MMMSERLDKYNAIWLSVPAYHDRKVINKSYEEASEWNGKVIKDISRYLLGVVTQSLQGISPTQSPIFNRAIEFTWEWLEFNMYARYKSHNDVILSYMEDVLHRFHMVKDVLLLGPASTNVKAKAIALRTEFVKKRKVEKKTNAETWTPSQKRCEMTHLQDFISPELDVSSQLDADFNCPKIH